MDINKIKKYLYSEDLNTNNELDLMFIDFNSSLSTPKIFTKNIQLNKSIKGDYTDEYLSLIDTLTKNTQKLNVPSNDIPKMKTIIFLAMNLIASNGRIGQGNVIVLSSDNYNKYKSIINDEKLEINIIDGMGSDYIYIYRKSKMKDEPGVIFCYNNDYYEFVSIGLYPENQFLKINIEK